MIPFNKRVRVPQRFGARHCCLALGVAGVVRARLAYGYDQDVQKLNRFVQTTEAIRPLRRLFERVAISSSVRTGRKQPRNSTVLSLTFPKTETSTQRSTGMPMRCRNRARRTRQRLPYCDSSKYFPSSSWRREADTMLVVLGRGDAVQQALDRNNCEIKILALQSLFQANEDRAISFVGDVLKSTSTDCPGLKSAAVSLLGSQGGQRAVPLLLEIARSQADMKLRLTAIRRLGERRGRRGFGATIRRRPDQGSKSTNPARALRNG